MMFAISVLRTPVSCAWLCLPSLSCVGGGSVGLMKWSPTRQLVRGREAGRLCPTVPGCACGARKGVSWLWLAVEEVSLCCNILG